MRTRRSKIWAAQLGLLALVLNALVPIHLAFDITEAVEASQCSAHAEPDNSAQRLLALLTGHHGANGKSGEHGKHRACPVCSALGSLAGLASPKPMALSAPLPPGLPATSSVVESESLGAPASYRSRAPPLA